MAELRRGRWFYKDRKDKIFGPFSATQMDSWKAKGYLRNVRSVSTRMSGPWVNILDLVKEAGDDDAFAFAAAERSPLFKYSTSNRNTNDVPSSTVSAPLQRSTSWTRPERLKRRKDLGEEGERFARALRGEIGIWIQSRKTKLERSNMPGGTNMSLDIVDSSSCRFDLRVGRKNIPLHVHYPETLHEGMSGQFLVKSTNASPECEALCRQVNSFARTNAYKSLNRSVRALLDEIIRAYDAQYSQGEKFDRFREAHGLDTPSSLPSPSSSTKAPTTPTSMGTVPLTRTRTMDAFKRTWARAGDAADMRKRPSSAHFVQSNSFLDEIDKVASPTAGTLLRKTKRRLLDELEHIFKTETPSRGIDVELVNKSPFHWRIYLSAFDSSSHFAKDLEAHAKRHNLDAAQVRIEIRFPAEYPKRPPEVRLVRPILQMYTGSCSGGAFGIPQLLREGWIPEERILDLIVELKRTLERSARVEMSSNASYPRSTFEASLARIGARTKNAFETAHSISGTFYCYSGSLARSVMRLRIPETFESGNKVLLPGSVLEKLQRRGAGIRSNSSDGLRSASSGGSDGGIGGGFGAIMGGGGLVFEITSPMGISSFCGVLQFNAPEDNMVIVPDWMMSNVFARNGMEVQLRCVELPKLSFLRVQPRKEDWSKIVKTTGLDPQTFMEQALQRYVSFSKGDDIFLSAYGEEMSFSVVEIKPNVPAGRLYDGFFAEVAFDIMEPLLSGSSGGDTSASTKTTRPQLQKTPSAQAREQRMENERFAKKWKEEQELRSRRDALKRSEGVPVDGFDASANVWRLKLRTHDGSSFILRCNPTTTCDRLHAALREECPVGKVSYTLSRTAGSTVPIPDLATRTLEECGVTNEVVLEQKLRTTGLCDACVLLRATPPRSAMKAHLFGKPRDVVRLCTEHRCVWLEKMLGSSQIEADEETALTKDFILKNLTARLI